MQVKGNILIFVNKKINIVSKVTVQPKYICAAIKHNFSNALQSNMNYAHKELIRFYAKILFKLFSSECDAQKQKCKK